MKTVRLLNSDELISVNLVVTTLDRKSLKIKEAVKNAFDYQYGSRQLKRSHYKNPTITRKIVGYDSNYIYIADWWTKHNSVNLRSLSLPLDLVKTLGEFSYNEYLLLTYCDFIPNELDCYQYYISHIVEIFKIMRRNSNA